MAGKQQTPSENTVYRLAELLTKRAEAAEAAARELQGGTRGGKSTLKAVEDGRKALEAAREALEASVEGKVDKLIEDAVETGLAKLGKETELAMRDNVAKAISEIDRLQNIV